MSAPEASDPVTLRQQVDAATGRMLATAAELTDEQVRAASPLPGWTRGHVLTHIARNADGLRNLLVWAHTGVVTPQYRDAQARNDDIEAGSGRAARELAADAAESAARFAAQAGLLTTAGWQVMVRGLNGPEHPAWVVLWRRLGEVELHHVDLDAGYRPADWPDWFVAERLESTAARFAKDGDAPAVLVTDDRTGRSYRTGPDPRITVTGPRCELLAWLSGRSRGAGLTVSPAGPPPRMPPW
jgi:maleylpyruvate isomerase